MKSSKTNCGLQRQIGANTHSSCTMDNHTFGILARMHYGVNVVAYNVDENMRKCSKCNMVMDCMREHALKCKK